MLFVQLVFVSICRDKPDMMMMIHRHQVFSSVVNSAACFLRRIAKFCANSLPGRALAQISFVIIELFLIYTFTHPPLPLYICVPCEERDTFNCLSHGQVCKDTHWQEYSMPGGRVGCQGNCAGDQTDRCHGGRHWSSGPSAYLAAPTSRLGLAVSKKSRSRSIL